MKIIYLLAIAGTALIANMASASAQQGSGGGDTTRPSYDFPRAYDRDAYGNETYRYHATPDYRHYRHYRRHHRHYDD